MKYIASLFALSTALLLVACGGSSSEFIANEETENSSQNSFVLEDNLRQEATAYLKGETIHFVFRLTNNGNEDIVLDFNSGQRYDAYLKDASNDVIWSWSSNRVFTQAFTELTIPVGETLEYRDSWDQILSDGSLPSTGNYSMHGYILNQAEQSVNFTIQ